MFSLRGIFSFFSRNAAGARGSLLLYVVVFGALAFSLVVVSVSGYAVSEQVAARYRKNSEQALQVAEAGINYYRWHLAHNQTDYQDGTGQSGPYLHTYEDAAGNTMGYFSLGITPPASGSTVVIISSTGWVANQPNSKRTIKARVGFLSLTDYAFLTNTDVWIGDTEVTHGKFHANGGIRFDGVGDAPITSAMATYTCKIFHGCGNQTKPGIWGDGGPSTYWKFPMPRQDFTAVTAKLLEIKSGAQSGGLYFSSSGKEGWRLQFTVDGKITAYKVNTTDCYKAKDVGDNNFFWPCIDIKTLGSGTQYVMPTNGFVYVDDTVWVDGVVKGRVTVGTKTGKSIIINGNLTYAVKDSANVLGLVAEQNILIPHNSPDVLEVDGAILAQNGAAKRYYYPGDTKTSLTIFGSVISSGLWTWSWASGGGAIVSGYENTVATYDSNLTYNPPGGFPVGSQYNLLSWEEIK